MILQVQATRLCALLGQRLVRGLHHKAHLPLQRQGPWGEVVLLEVIWRMVFLDREFSKIGKKTIFQGLNPSSFN
jgi:hypothetical protein